MYALLLVASFLPWQWSQLLVAFYKNSGSMSMSCPSAAVLLKWFQYQQRIEKVALAASAKGREAA
jgi:hypothetical protein